METTHSVVLVTGATGAIGKAIAQQLATRPAYEVILLGREEHRTRSAAREVRDQSGNQKVTHELVDLSSRRSVDKLAARIQKPIQILINNAAATPRRREQTQEGIERQFATNVLGYLWMIQAFADQLKEAEKARVVNVASYWAGDLVLEDLEFKRRPYNNNIAYRQSKQADRMLTVALAGRLEPHGVTVNACHPGDVNSRLSNSLGFGGHESPRQGASTPVWLATAPELAGETGKYFEHMRLQRCRFGEDSNAVEALYSACLAY